MAQKSIRARIGADRANALFWATLASLPVWAFAVLCVGAAGYIVFSEDNADDRGSAFIVAAIVLVFAYLFTIIARWTFSSVRAALTPQRIQAMWLRRFQSERGSAFRTSRVIDQLARFGISALTLQDRDVQLSFEQRRNRLAPMFWLIFTPIVALGGVGAFSAFRDVERQAEQWRPSSDNLAEAFGQIFAHALGTAVILVLIIVVALLAFMTATLIIMALAALAGPVGAMASRNRDDYAKLPLLLRTITAGKRKGATVLRISDAHWREAVSASLKAADAAIIDLTSVTDNIAWEIGEAVSAVGAQSIVFICMDTGIKALPQEAVAKVRATLGAPPKDVVFYPASRHEKRGGQRFARALREAIYAAAERTQSV